MEIPQVDGGIGHGEDSATSTNMMKLDGHGDFATIYCIPVSNTFS